MKKRKLGLIETPLYILSLSLIGISMLASPNLWAATTLTLRKAVHIAATENPSLLVSREKVHEAKIQIPIARANLLPTVSLTGSATTKKDAANSPAAQFNGEAYNQYQVDLQGNQPLFTYGAFDGIDSVRKDWAVAGSNKTINVRDLVSQVIQTYFKVILDSRNVTSLKQQQKIEKEALTTAVRRERLGRGQLLDVLQVKTQLAMLRSQLTSAQDQVQEDASTLAYLLGDNSKTYIIDSNMETPTLSQVDEQIKTTPYDIPELDINAFTLQKTRDLKSVQLGQNLPMLKASGDLMYSNTKADELITPYSRSWNLGLTLTVPIFSGLSSIYQQRELDAQLSELNFEQTNLQNKFTMQNIVDRKKVESAHESILSGKEALRLATESSQEARRNYRLATIDFLQFLTVQQSLLQAEQALNTARYSYIESLTNYYVASGRPLKGLVDLLERANQ